MTWLVTGGAGYIGAHVVRALLEAGLPAVVVDDLSSGHKEFVPAGVTFVGGSILDGAHLLRAFRDHQVTGVIHVAGFKYAGVSVQRPYGESKLIGEWLMRDQEIAAGLRHTSLRYFNVVGSGYPDVFDTSPHNLFPLVFEALVEGRTPTINGDDYPTPDGTNVRDYVHVSDIAASHVAAAKRLEAGDDLEPAYNLGSGEGLSVRQIMDAMARVTGIDFVPAIGPRRPGDPPRIVASGELAARDLDWRMRHSIDEMVDSAWRARKASGAAGAA
jgi:UDP-glucose 4-epimerase